MYLYTDYNSLLYTVVFVVIYGCFICTIYGRIQKSNTNVVITIYGRNIFAIYGRFVFQIRSMLPLYTDLPYLQNTDVVFARCGCVTLAIYGCVTMQYPDVTFPIYRRVLSAVYGPCFCQILTVVQLYTDVTYFRNTDVVLAISGCSTLALYGCSIL